MKLRTEGTDDQQPIFAVNKAAFATDAEARLVDMLREDGDLYFSQVAEEDGTIIGHIALSPMDTTADDRPVKALGLGPVAVAPNRQHEGVGSQLVQAAIRWAQSQDWQLIILLGNPRYYSRFGFSVEDAKPFASPFAGPYFQALWLDETAQKPQSGRAEYAPAFGRL
ncbi:GNAT family N-acetyltransferase [Sphingorhabdus sp. EL138]|jgi:putative acetyltransferase|uniref:GNAT family N-acetyltransferase n=1 Tax=Sphingorhabdus sp. EL138 TaxID=2073156 RepID=UPI000D686175|nr:N-acetyltransferase [Sphingorhabdus sp. EL138]